VARIGGWRRGYHHAMIAMPAVLVEVIGPAWVTDAKGHRRYAERNVATEAGTATNVPSDLNC
jgi:hypothetical protein